MLLSDVCPGVEHIVVQSYDGQLTFFEQEALAFSRFLPGFLLPGPLAYAAASDSFITSTASLQLVTYKYSVLAAASGGKEQQQGKVVLRVGSSSIQCWNRPGPIP